MTRYEKMKAIRNNFAELVKDLHDMKAHKNLRQDYEISEKMCQVSMTENIEKRMTIMSTFSGYLVVLGSGETMHCESLQQVETMLRVYF